MKCWYNKWRVERHSAGVKRRSYILGRTRIKRMYFLINEGYRINFMWLCYCRRLKLRLGSRKVIVARVIIVAIGRESNG